MATQAGKQRWNPWPVSIIAFFTVAITGCLTFVIFCSRHPADLIAADYYEQEVKYQGQIERMQAAKQQPGDSSVTYDAHAQQIVVSLSAAADAKVQGTIHLYRPSAMDQDRTVKLQPDINGQQQIDTASLSPGLWKVRVSWKTAEKEYQIDRSVVLIRAS